MPLCYETAATATKTSLLSDVLKKVNSRCFNLFVTLIPSRLIRQMLASVVLELNSKGLYQSSEKEKESCCLVFPSSKN